MRKPAARRIDYPSDLPDSGQTMRPTLVGVRHAAETHRILVLDRRNDWLGGRAGDAANGSPVSATVVARTESDDLARLKASVRPLATAVLRIPAVRVGRVILKGSMLSLTVTEELHANY